MELGSTIRGRTICIGKIYSPSERNFAYKMKMAAMKRIGVSPSKEKGGQIGPPFFEGKSRDILDIMK